MPKEKSKWWLIRGLALAVFLLILCGGTALWLRADRRFDFISKHDGRPIPYGMKSTPDTAKLVERAKKDKSYLCFGFTGDPKKIKANIESELKTKEWVIDDSMDGLYMRADFDSGEHNGFPDQEMSNMKDLATFEDDPKVLDVPKRITYIFTVPRKSNYAELAYRWTHRNEKPPEN